MNTVKSRVRARRGAAPVFFQSHLDDDTDECVIWPYGIGDVGYGVMRLDGVAQRVHVLACIYHYGPPPSPDMQATHGPCHNRACFNGRHLSWNTRVQNMADKRRDGTHREGEQNHRAILTAAQVIAIRDRHSRGGVSQAELAREFGVVPGTIQAIVRFKNWRNA